MLLSKLSCNHELESKFDQYILLRLSSLLLNLFLSGFIEEECVIPCPFDCKLSDWSSWGPCSSSCGIGVRIRSKWLKEKPYDGGRPCPKLDLKNQVKYRKPQTKAKTVSRLLFSIKTEVIVLLQAAHKRLSQIQKGGSEGSLT